MKPAVPSAKECRAIERWMATDEFRARVERVRARFHAGEEFNFPALAKELDLPLDYVTAKFAALVKRAFGVNIRPVGRPH